MHSVCARSMGGCRGGYRGEWSQVVSGVVTLGCLSPRPRLCAPVGACLPVCAPVCACAGVCAGVCGCVCVLIGGVCTWCGGVV